MANAPSGISPQPSSTNSKICIVGEAWGTQEQLLRLPFIGQAGQLLTRLLAEAKIERSKCTLTNLFNFHPDNNDLSTLCGKRSVVTASYPDALPGLKSAYPLYPWPISYTFPALVDRTQYLLPEHLSSLGELHAFLLAAQPKLVFLLGNTPCWGVLGRTGITNLRGNLAQSDLYPSMHFLPTYHPAAVLRQWALRPSVIADFQKGAALLERGFVQAERIISIEPSSVEELYAWWERVVDRESEEIACDIETKKGLITCIGFGTTREALCVPLYDARRGGSFWDSSREMQALNFIRYALQSPNPKVFQNGLYDIQYIYKTLGFTVRNAAHDTMLLHHSLFPEMQKDLGFLGATYTDIGEWKQMRQFKRDTEKRDE